VTIATITTAVRPRDDTRATPEILPLTGLRALAAWWVVAFHFARHLVPEGAAQGVLESGHLAVDVFFVLSGYVLARRYEDEPLETPAARRAFWVRRFARLYPLYLVSLALGVAAAWPSAWTDLATARGVARDVVQLLALNAWWHRAMFAHNWAAWSLSVEAFFYALFPFLFVRVRRLQARGAALLFVACWAALLVAPAIYGALDPDRLGRPFAMDDEVLGGWYLKFFPLQRLPEFLAGIATARLARSGAAHGWLAAASGAALVAVGAAGLVPYAYLHSGVLLPFVALLVAGLDHAGASPLGRAWPVALGRASYATYILHVPLALLFGRFDPSFRRSPSHFAAYCALLLVASLVAHRAIEEPARVYLTRRFARSRST
jgi:peptidoglycan/LPS O-acetylase OafA/YrhL